MEKENEPKREKKAAKIIDTSEMEVDEVPAPVGDKKGPKLVSKKNTPSEPEVETEVPPTPVPTVNISVTTGDEPAISFTAEQIHAAFVGATRVRIIRASNPLNPPFK